MKNQFRALDEDEVEFLDAVLESTRAQEAAVKKETADQLEVFRKQREEAEKLLLGPTSSEVTPAEEEEWSLPARKRRREKKDLLLPGKKRKASTEGNGNPTKTEHEKPNAGHDSTPAAKTDKESQSLSSKAVPKATEKNARKSSAGSDEPQMKEKERSDTKQQEKPAPIFLGLAAYGSDSE